MWFCCSWIFHVSKQLPVSTFWWQARLLLLAPTFPQPISLSRICVRLHFWLESSQVCEFFGMLVLFLVWFDVITTWEYKMFMIKICWINGWCIWLWAERSRFESGQGSCFHCSQGPKCLAPPPPPPPHPYPYMGERKGSPSIPLLIPPRKGPFSVLPPLLSFSVHFTD